VTWIDPLAVEAPESGADARNPAERASRAALTAGAIAATPGHDPASIAVRGEREVAVRAAVAGLEEPYREVVALRFFGDLSLAEIAQVSERPLGTVKTHLRRGLGRLRDSLAIAAVR
jgi:RNA polymerase sigma-70 factor (ECF subfamily)